MPSYSYTARETASGREIHSTVEAATEQAAVAALLNRSLLVVSIEEKISKKGKTKGGRVSLADLVVFTRQLATMVDAGIAIVQSLQGLADQTPNKAMRDVIRDICTRVESGESFSEALQKHPKAFSKLYVSMVAAGEKGGLLAEILARLATYLESSAKLRRKVKTTMMYPIVVSTVAIGITIFLLVKVVPVFKDVYESFGAKLPAPTQFLMNISDFMGSYWLLVIILLGAITYGWMAFIKTKGGRDFWDSRRIKLPIFGPIAHKICLVRFTRTLSSLIRSGVPILEVLQIVSQTVDNTVMERAIKSASADIERGEGIASALGKYPVFPSMIVRMISAGEQTGNIDNMLERVSNFLDEEVETMLSGLMSLLEPLLIVFLGLLIGSMVVCMYLPIFNLGNIVSGNGN
jgi:type IV pilus assembly protein PilC